MPIKKTIPLLCLALVACKSTPPKEVVSVVPPETQESNADKVGEFLIASAEDVWTEYDCGAAKALPFSFLEEQRLTPEAVVAGAQLTHHFTYVLCSGSPDKTYTGTLYRKIYYKGRRIYDGSQAFELKPGRWEVNAIIEVPKQARLGTYTLGTEFIGRASKKKEIMLIKKGEFKVVEEDDDDGEE